MISENQIRSFVKQAKHSPVVCITCGGATSRPDDDIGSGERGASFAEYVLSQGYVVIYLYQIGKFQPFEKLDAPPAEDLAKKLSSHPFENNEDYSSLFLTVGDELHDHDAGVCFYSAASGPVLKVYLCIIPLFVRAGPVFDGIKISWPLPHSFFD
jgi:hypothetical protein